MESNLDTLSNRQQPLYQLDDPNQFVAEMMLLLHHNNLAESNQLKLSRVSPIEKALVVELKFFPLGCQLIGLVYCISHTV